MTDGNFLWLLWLWQSPCTALTTCRQRGTRKLKESRSHFYQTRSTWSVDQGSNKNHYPAYNFAPTVTKFCVMWEGNCRCKIVDRRAFPIWSLIRGLRWSGLIKAEPGEGRPAGSPVPYLTPGSVVPEIHKPSFNIRILLGVEEFPRKLLPELDVVGTSSPEEVVPGVLGPDPLVTRTDVEVPLGARLRHRMHDTSGGDRVDVRLFSAFWKNSWHIIKGVDYYDTSPSFQKCHRGWHLHTGCNNTRHLILVCRDDLT